MLKFVVISRNGAWTSHMISSSSTLPCLQTGYKVLFHLNETSIIKYWILGIGSAWKSPPLIPWRQTTHQACIWESFQVPPNRLWPRFKGRWCWEGKYGQRWLSFHFPFSEERKGNILAGIISLGSKALSPPGHHALPDEDPVSHAQFGWESSCIIRQASCQLHNWICNQYLPELQPKALLTALRSSWIITKPHDWMIH